MSWISCLILIVADPAPATSLPNAHAHNDYYHENPLTDALSYGYGSIEVDVFARGERLLVGHDENELRPSRNLRSLYLDPLQQRVQRMNGRVYADGLTLTLLVDFKSEAETTYRVLTRILASYESMLERDVQGKRVRGPVRIIISGNRPFKLVAEAATRLSFIDGRLTDLTDRPTAAWIPLISDRWSAHFQWDGTGSITAAERDKLQRLVQQTHAQGRQIRFWATPDRPSAWQVLLDAQVDWINTDDLAGLSMFLRPSE